MSNCAGRPVALFPIGLPMEVPARPSRVAHWCYAPISESTVVRLTKRKFDETHYDVGP